VTKKNNNAKAIVIAFSLCFT